MPRSSGCGGFLLRSSGSPGLRDSSRLALAAGRRARRFASSLPSTTAPSNTAEGLARVDRQRQHGKDVGTLEHRGHFDFGVLFREHECGQSRGASLQRVDFGTQVGHVAAVDHDDLHTPRLCGCRQRERGGLDRRDGRRPGEALSESSSRKSSRVVRAMISTAACADAGACSGRWETLASFGGLALLVDAAMTVGLRPRVQRFSRLVVPCASALLQFT